MIADEIIKQIKGQIPKEVVIEAGIINNPEDAEKALYNEFGTEKIPARPFIRRGLDDLDIKDKTPSDIGRQMVSNMRNAILRSDYVRNAPSTVRKKGFDFPLVETGDMYKHLTFKVKEKK